MKIIKQKPLVLFSGIIVCLLVIYAILWHFPKVPGHLIYLSWLAGLLVLWQIIFPRRTFIKQNTTSDIPPNQLPPSSWLMRIIMTELALFVIYYSIKYWCLHFSPVPITGIATTHFFDTKELVQLSLFPWTIIALTTVTLGIVAFNHKKSAYLHTLLPFSNRLTTHHPIAIIINGLARFGSLIILPLTSVFFCLWVVHLFFSTDDLQNILGLHTTGLICCTLLFLLTNNKRIKRIIYHLNGKYGIPPGLTLMLGLGFISVLLCSCIYFFDGLPHRHFIIPAAVQKLIQHGWQLNWQLFSISWWSAWILLMSCLFASWSQGYSIRLQLLAIILPPLFISNMMDLFLKINLLNIQIPGLLVSIFGIIAFLFLIICLIRKNQWDIITQTYFPKSGITIFRSQHNYIYNIIRFTSLVFYLFLPVGFVILPLICLPACFSLIVIVMGGFYTTVTPFHTQLFRKFD